MIDFHDWVDATTLSDPGLVFVCADPWCDEIKREPRPPVEQWVKS